ncbi:g7278 [Coccomyxa elongata]
METDFPTRGYLAEHLVGKRHSGGESVSACPYCGEPCSDRGKLKDHIRHQCQDLEIDCIPAAQIRRIRQEELDSDPCYAPVHQVHSDMGRIVIRPMHREHIFETALLLTEAFLVDRNPPTFPWMIADLQRVCKQYERDPRPITAHNPGLGPDSTTDLSSCSYFTDPAEQYRIQTEDAWGRWLWLVAELVPNDPSLAPAGQDSRVIGATALMFHDRSVSIRKMQRLRPPLPAVALNFSLWLARTPPEGLQVNRAAFIWWTGVHYKMRRKGVAQAIVRACEGVAAAANFWDIYIQAATISRDSKSPLGGWLCEEYKVARAAYSRAGYKKWTHTPARQVPWSSDVDDSADLMYKQLYSCPDFLQS